MTFVKNEIGINDDNKAANEHDPEFKSAMMKFVFVSE